MEKSNLSALDKAVYKVVVIAYHPLHICLKCQLK
jgi:hypothetical protein